MQQRYTNHKNAAPLKKHVQQSEMAPSGVGGDGGCVTGPRRREERRQVRNITFQRQEENMLCRIEHRLHQPLNSLETSYRKPWYVQPF